MSTAPSVHSRLLALDPADAQYASRFVDLLLAAAGEQGASDVHLQPTAEGLEVRWRIDGVLLGLGCFPPGVATNVVTRLKVMADLLTYHTDMPQEGRIRVPQAASQMRLSTFPTLHGEKAVVRFFAGSDRLLRLGDLGLGDDVQQGLDALLYETSGAVLVSGPAGSGKTTTLYACLRELVSRSGGGRNIVTLEDPIEVAISGLSQSQVQPASGFDLASGLRSVMRQDPEVILIGEIRDRPTAEGALQASLTGQLVLSSFHCGSAAAAVSRLCDMGIEPYVLRSGLLAIVSQRLVRRLCQCATTATDERQLVGLPVKKARIVAGCDQCSGSGYRGRMVLAELLKLDSRDLGQAILARSEAAAIERLAVAGGMVSLASRALAAVESGLTSPAEVRRVFGIGELRI